MNIIVHSFMGLPFPGRVAISAFIILLFYRIFYKVILWGLSIIPLVLQKVFRSFYLLIETPTALLHKNMGIYFYKFDNKISYIGGKIDDILQDWYQLWHKPEKIHLWKLILVYIVYLALIILPSLIKVESDIYRKGEYVYLRYENMLVEWIGKQNGSNKIESDTSAGSIKSTQDLLDESENSSITLTVSGLNSSLLVRDIPSTVNSTKLDRLYNGDTVSWSGLLIFSETEDGNVEPWVKVNTANGIEGWTRLSYLCPEQYNNTQFYVEKLNME